MQVLERLIGLRLHYVFASVHLDRPELTDLAPGYSARFIELDELDGYADLGVDGLDATFLQLARERGDTCIGNFYMDELVGYSFQSSVRARVTSQLDVLVPPGFEYGYKGWTHPDHRRRGLNHHRADVSRARKARPTVIFYVETTNYPSLLKIKRPPSRRRLHLGYVGWVSVLDRQIPFSSRQARWIGLLFVRNDDVAIRNYTEV